MTLPQALILVVLALTMILFVWGRWRHDVVALMALMTAVLIGLVPSDRAFLGFGHPAVITVAAVLILSRGLSQTGVVNLLARHTLPGKAGPTYLILSFAGVGAFLSAFMNNVGAMALLMPVAMQAAARNQVPPAILLMPLSFGTILGGMTTMIGTPPNIIVASYRSNVADSAFSMFDFTPVGIGVAAIGIVFVALLGWRLIPKARHSRKAGIEDFDVGAYLTEARVSDDNKAVGKSLRDLEAALEEMDAQIVGLVRDEERILLPGRWRQVRPGDVLIIEAEPEAIGEALSALGLELVGEGKLDLESLQSEDVELMEAVIRPDSMLIGRNARELRIRSRYNINLLAVSREGRHARQRLHRMRLQPGDVLLLQGQTERIADFIATYGCVPLGHRDIKLPSGKAKAGQAAAIMAAAVVLTSTGLLSAPIAFALGALGFVVLRLLPLRGAYEAIDWSVIVLLAALIPIAEAVSVTGAAELMSRSLVESVGNDVPLLGLIGVIVITMFLSDVMNNAATAAVMSPIALSLANQLQVNPDAYLMGVAVGASCAFLTPIGHQNNTLILGPGGYRFGDYWRMGLPLEIVVVAVSVPLILLVWGL